MEQEKRTMKKKVPTIEVFSSHGCVWYWRLRARNGEIVADGAEGYATRGNALRAARRSQKIMAEAVILPAKIIV